MIKQTFTFVDYAGTERTETHYFNINEAEALEMEMSTSGGLTQMIRDIIDAQNMPEIIKLFKDLILKSYGKVSPDGRRFIKSEELRNDFMQTEAYSQLFMKLSTDTNAASEFVNGVIEGNKKVSTAPTFDSLNSEISVNKPEIVAAPAVSEVQ